MFRPVITPIARAGSPSPRIAIFAVTAGASPVANHDKRVGDIQVMTIRDWDWKVVNVCAFWRPLPLRNWWIDPLLCLNNRISLLTLTARELHRLRGEVDLHFN